MTSEPKPAPRTALEAFKELTPLLLDFDDAQKRRMLGMARDMLDAISAAIKVGGDVENDPERLALRDRFIDEAPTVMEAALLLMVAILASPAEK